MRLVEPLTLRMFGAVEMHLLASRPDMTEIVLRDFPTLDQSATELLLYAMDEDKRQLHFVPGSELHDFLGTREGIVLALWLMTRRSERDLSWEAIEEHVEHCDDLELRRLHRAIELVSCLDERAEKDWIRIPTDEADEGRMNWKHLVRRLCEAYFGISPNDVGEMTLFEVRLMSLGEGDVRGMRKTLGEFRRLQREGKLADVPIKWEPKRKRGA